MIEERLATFQIDAETNNDNKKNKRRLVFLDNLLTQMHNEKLSLDDIQEEVDTFIFEGHDTTAAAINFFCYLVGCYPDVQVKIHAEMDSIFGGNSFILSFKSVFCLFKDDRERPCTMEDIEQMTYLDCVIKVNDKSFEFKDYFYLHRNLCVFFHQFRSLVEKHKKILFIVS